jgi:hypothetical protein
MKAVVKIVNILNSISLFLLNLLIGEPLHTLQTA